MKIAISALSLSLLYCLPAASQVSATAAPVSNSSGSVVNQSVQVTPSDQHRYRYGSGIQCDAATLNVTPFASGVHAWGDPNNEFYQENVYDNSDNYGYIDPVTGVNGPDGIPDNPGRVLYTRPMRTGYRSNFSSNLGITATLSVPLDRRAIDLCVKAAKHKVSLYEQDLADKRLNYEMGRLRACAKAKRENYGFAKNSPMYAICADVVVKPISQKTDSSPAKPDFGASATADAPAMTPASPSGQAAN